MVATKKTYAFAIGQLHVGTKESRNALDAFIALEITWNWRHRNGEPIPREVAEFYRGVGRMDVFCLETNKTESGTIEDWKRRVRMDTYGTDMID